MKALTGFGDRLLKSRAAQRICHYFGIDICQYRLLLKLFDTLSNRMEFLGITAGLSRVSGYLIFISAVISLIALAHPPLPVFLATSISLSMFMVFVMAFVDVGNSLMNPDEASTLAHLPIRGATYIAAKLTRLLTVIAAIILSLNAIPALAGLSLPESRWFYPLTHLLAACLAGLFIGFFVCGVYGWLFHLVSPANLKNAALWLQFAMAVGYFVGVSLMNAKRAILIRILGTLLKSSWMPWRWFVAIGLTGQAKYPGFSAWEAGAACLTTMLLIAFGLRAFRADYLIKASDLMRGNTAGSGRSPRRSWLNPLVFKLTGAPSGYGAFSWVGVMMRRDWTFRMQGLVYICLGGLSLAILAVTKIRVSPFDLKTFAPIHALPHMLGMMLAIVCKLMSYTAEPQGAGLFTALPLGQLRPFVHGIFLVLWLPVAILHLALLGPCIWFWGVTEAMLFIGYSLALVSLYLSLTILFVDGIPFASAFKPYVTKSMGALYMIMLVPILVSAGIQWVCFRNVFLVATATPVLAALAYATAHFSLQRFESKVRANLKLLSFSPQQIFKETGE